MNEGLRDPVLLFRARTPAQAALASGILAPEGVACYVDGPFVNDVAGNYAMHTALAARNPLVYVPRAELARARALLVAAWGRIDAAPEPVSAVRLKPTLLFLGACLFALVGLLLWMAR